MELYELFDSRQLCNLGQHRWNLGLGTQSKAFSREYKLQKTSGTREPDDLVH